MEGGDDALLLPVVVAMPAEKRSHPGATSREARHARRSSVALPPCRQSPIHAINVKAAPA